MAIFHKEIAQRYSSGNIIMDLDGAGWHKSKSTRIPDNMRLLYLPPNLPELKSIGHLWDELREKYFHNLAFDILGALEDQLVNRLRNLELDQARIKNICS